MTMQRNPVYYISNIILPLFLLSTMVLASTLPSVELLNERMSISLSLVLTVVAVKFTTASYLPPVGYLTSLDKYVLASLLFVLCVALENCILMMYVCVGHCVHIPDEVLAGANEVEVYIAAALLSAWLLFNLKYVVVAWCGDCWPWTVRASKYRPLGLTSRSGLLQQGDS